MTDTPSKSRRPRFEPHELILSEVADDDLLSIVPFPASAIQAPSIVNAWQAEGYYAAFGQDWFDRIEPLNLRPSDHSLPKRRFAERMKPWIREPHTRWTKITLSSQSADFDPSNPNRVIGHAGWLLPARTQHEVVNFWRKDASDELNWRQKMGWSKEYEDELWSHVNLEVYQDQGFIVWDRNRKANVGGIPHWHLAPLWVHPAFQGRGVASVLLKDGIELAEKTDERPVMYLEAMPDARVVYRHFGYVGIKAHGSNVMIRNPPLGIEILDS
ncbi:hypothetical protein CC78DRAFT_538004 [Lojkania enalia]|uniref:N-acetyltransferase domain-containing protein n=1 Tax=Lojkania enalia TaxID=147567 RepID=A0A9P4JXC2_9PLEO|nr:hypothetical protein CC78DRAFT_538004 [Didymosphaeria enalia]